jgi:hypothetical protein
VILTKNYERGLPSLYSEQNISLDFFLLNFDCGQLKSSFVTIMERNYFCLFCEGVELWERAEKYFTHTIKPVLMSNSEEGPAVNNEQPVPGTNKN